MNKNILVTGSDGFIGKALIKRLKELDYKVKTFDIKNGDITEYKFKIKNIDHVFHLAAKTFVPLSWKEPFDFYKVNFLGTANILEFCRKTNASLTYLSSYVYGTPQRLPIKEDHPTSSKTPYNHSKLLAEELCTFYAKNLNVDVIILRPTNVYGPNQNENFLIPTILNQVTDPKIDTIKVMDLKPKRDYIFIEDLVDAMIKSIDYNEYNIFNVGSGYSLSVEEIIKNIFKVTGINKKYISLNIDRKGEVMDVVADISKIRKQMKWKPKTDFYSGIKKILEDK